MKAWSARLRGRWGLIILAAIFGAEVGLAWRGYQTATQALIELRVKKMSGSNLFCIGQV